MILSMCANFQTDSGQPVVITHQFHAENTFIMTYRISVLSNDVSRASLKTAAYQTMYACQVTVLCHGSCCYNFLLPLQLAPHLGGVRTRYKSTAVDASSGFAGFPDLLQGMARSSSQKVYSDQVCKATTSASLRLPGCSASL